MRIMVFFDLPVATVADRKQYALFRRYLQKSGFIMMQESVYSKLAINERIANGVIERLKANRPPKGLVQVLKITERQYATIEQITGQQRAKSELDDTDELVVL